MTTIGIAGVLHLKPKGVFAEFCRGAGVLEHTELTAVRLDGGVRSPASARPPLRNRIVARRAPARGL